MVRKFYAQNKQFQGVKELKKAIIEAWHQVDKDLNYSLYLSQDHRIFEVISRNGGPTDYWLCNFPSLLYVCCWIT